MRKLRLLIAAVVAANVACSAPATDPSTLPPTTSSPRTVNATDGTIVLFGGGADPADCQADTWIFDPSADTWNLRTFSGG